MHSRRNPHRARRKLPGFPARLSVAAVAAVATVSFLAMAAPAGASTASPSAATATAAKASTATASTQGKPTTAPPADWVQPTTPADVPYTLPVQLPSTTSSPAVAADAPYTPAVLNLIAQLEPSNSPTEAQLANASILFHGGTNTTCNNVGPDGRPDRHQAEHHAALLDRRPGRQHLLRPERGEDHRPDDADEPGVILRHPAGQRLGPDRGNRGPRAHGHRAVRPADRHRPAAQLGPQPDHHRRGPVPESARWSPRRSTASRAPARCPR